MPDLNQYRNIADVESGAERIEITANYDHASYTGDSDNVIIINKSTGDVTVTGFDGDDVTLGAGKTLELSQADDGVWHRENAISAGQGELVGEETGVSVVNGGINPVTTTFTPAVDGRYTIRYFGTVNSGEGGITVRDGSGVNITATNLEGLTFSNEPTGRLDITNNDKTVTYEFNGGETYEVDRWAGGGGNITNYELGYRFIDLDVAGGVSTDPQNELTVGSDGLPYHFTNFDGYDPTRTYLEGDIVGVLYNNDIHIWRRNANPTTDPLNEQFDIIGARPMRFVFADETTLAPAIAGEPTLAEIRTWVNSADNGRAKDSFIPYNGTDTYNDDATRGFITDTNGDVIEIALAGSVVWETFDSNAATLDLTVNGENHYRYTGAGDATWTLSAGTTGLFTIQNQNTGELTLSASGTSFQDNNTNGGIANLIIPSNEIWTFTRQSGGFLTVVNRYAGETQQDVNFTHINGNVIIERFTHTVSEEISGTTDTIINTGFDIRDIDWIEIDFGRNANAPHNFISTGIVPLKDFPYDSDEGGIVHFNSNVHLRVRIDEAERATGVLRISGENIGALTYSIPEIRFMKRAVGVSNRVGEMVHLKSSKFVDDVDALNQGYLAVKAGTVADGAINYPIWASIYSEFVSGDDIVFPADVAGNFLRNIGGNAGVEGVFQDDEQARSPNDPVNTQVNGGGGQTVRGVSTNPETRPENRAYQLYTIVDSYHEIESTPIFEGENLQKTRIYATTTQTLDAIGSAITTTCLLYTSPSPRD